MIMRMKKNENKILTKDNIEAQIVYHNIQFFLPGLYKFPFIALVII